MLRSMRPPWVADIEWVLLLFFLLIALGVDIFVGDSTRKKYILYGILVLPGIYSFSRVSSPQSTTRRALSFISSLGGLQICSSLAPKKEASHISFDVSVHLTKSKAAPIFVQVKEKNSTIVNSLQLLSGWGICSAALLWGSNTVVARLCTTVLYASFLHIFTLASVSTAAKHRSFWRRFIVGGIMVWFYHTFFRNDVQ